jgi:hypothetical protein
VDNSTIAIVGAWFGTLGLMLGRSFPTAGIQMIDIDKRCKIFVDNIIHDISNIEYITQDMYDHIYREDIVINTSCEHIPDIKKWISLIPPKKTLVLQSNNYIEPPDHISTASSIEEFVEQTGLASVWYSGCLIMPMYTRYMIIGRT